MTPGETRSLQWQVPETNGYPIQNVGVLVNGSAYLDYLTWSGVPAVTFKRVPGTVWKRQWVNGVSEHAAWGEAFRIVQNEGTGLFMTGCREWGDYRVESAVTPHLVASGGIVARIQGMQRYYALELVRGGGVRLVKALDGRTVLGEAEFKWSLGDTVTLALEVDANEIKAFVNGELLIAGNDEERPLLHGGIGLILTEGRMAAEEVSIRPMRAMVNPDDPLHWTFDIESRR